MFAPQCHDKQVERRRLAQERHAASQTQGEQLMLRPLPFPRNEVCGVGLVVKLVTRREIQTLQPLEFVGSEGDEVADEVRDEVVGGAALETEREKLQRLLGG